MSQNYNFIVEENEVGLRLDKFLAQKFSAIKSEITRSKILDLINDNQVKNIDNNSISASQKVKLNQQFLVILPEVQIHKLNATKIDFKIIFEDQDLLVIDKPAYLTVHPGNGNQDNTLVNGLLYSFKNNLSHINGEFRPGIVHRLDKDTSGLMLVAKNDFSHLKLSQMLKDRDVKRHYLAFIFGVMNPLKGTINENIGRSRANRLKMQTGKSAKRNAITHYQTRETFVNNLASLVEVKLDTGRTHQIRVHFEAKKHSLIGDQLYNSCKKNPPSNLKESLIKLINTFQRQALHSYKIEFNHPRTNEKHSFEIPLPADLAELYEELKNG
jgi:23S rRNA pseudouridine1911/1915/1917 synthase